MAKPVVTRREKGRGLDKPGSVCLLCCSCNLAIKIFKKGINSMLNII